MKVMIEVDLEDLDAVLAVATTFVDGMGEDEGAGEIRTLAAIKTIEGLIVTATAGLG